MRRHTQASTGPAIQAPNLPPNQIGNSRRSLHVNVVRPGPVSVNKNSPVPEMRPSWRMAMRWGGSQATNSILSMVRRGPIFVSTSIRVPTPLV